MYIFHILIIFTYGLVEDCPSEHFSRPSDQISILTRRLWNLVKYLSSTMQHYPLFVSLFQATKDATTVKMTSLDPVDPLYPPPDLPHPPTHSTPILTGSSSFSSSTDQPSFLCDTTSITEMNCLIVKKHQMPLTPPFTGEGGALRGHYSHCLKSILRNASLDHCLLFFSDDGPLTATPNTTELQI